jgi:hypothetical protein
MVWRYSSTYSELLQQTEMSGQHPKEMVYGIYGVGGWSGCGDGVNVFDKR